MKRRTPITAIWTENGIVRYRTLMGDIITAGRFPHALSTRVVAYDDDVVLEGDNEYGVWTSHPDKYDRVYPHEFGALLAMDDIAYAPSPMVNYIDLETTELWGDVELIADGYATFKSQLVCASIDEEPIETLDEINEAETMIVGYNLFNYDLQVLKQKYGYVLGIHGFKLTPFRYGGDVKDVEVPDGDREYIDLYLQTLRWDVENGGKLISFGLKDVVEQMGLRERQGAKEWVEAHHDREAYIQYALEDILDTAALSDHLLPVLLAQTQILPCRLTHIGVMGAGQKVDAILVGTYIKAKQSVPKPKRDEREIQGALVDAVPGVYRGEIIKADFTSMYPSIIVNEHLVPKGDVLEVYPKWMSLLREKRVSAKKTNPTLSAALKILINSFYGYTGSNFPFSDRDIANKITATGRELVQRLRSLLMQFGRHINTDTDGVLIEKTSDEDISTINDFINRELQPYQVELEVYDAALVIKKKNYILAKDGKIAVVKGNSLRNRSDEPFLQEWIQALLLKMLEGGELTEDELWAEIAHLLGKISPDNAFQRKRVGKFMRIHRAELVDGFEDGAKVDVVKTPDGWALRDKAQVLDLPYYLQRIISAVGRFGGRYEDFSKRYNKKQALQQKLDELGIDIAITAKAKKRINESAIERKPKKKEKEGAKNK